MHNMLVVNAEGPETRVAVVEEGSLAEFFVERKRDRGIVGNIYRGKITRVLPGMQAAFVDLGPKVERAAFLYVADVLGSGDAAKLFEDSETDDADESPEGAASRLARSRKQLANRKIEDLLKPGQNVVVQVVKDPIGQKGARVTGYISLPGRYSVFMPHVSQVGVSKRIGSDKERRRLRDLVNEARPKGTGFIVRTAAEDANDQELRDDVDFLARLWSEIEARENDMKGPGLVYADLDLVLRCIRDLMREDTSEVVVDDEEQYERMRKFTLAFLPRFAERIKKYENRRPLFDHYHIEPALRLAVSRRVPLKSGGSLVIDQGEALTAIDINTGSFTNTGSGNLADTVTANNLEACEEVAPQLRLRNIRGILRHDLRHTLRVVMTGCPPSCRAPKTHVSSRPMPRCVTSARPMLSVLQGFLVHPSNQRRCRNPAAGRPRRWTDRERKDALRIDPDAGRGRRPQSGRPEIWKRLPSDSVPSP